MHAGHQKRFVGKRAVVLATAFAVVGHSLKGVQEALKGEARRRELRLEVPAREFQALTLEKSFTRAPSALRGSFISFNMAPTSKNRVRARPSSKRIDVEVRSHGAMRVRSQVRPLNSPEAPINFENGDVQESGNQLYLSIMPVWSESRGKVGLGEALLLQVAAIDASGEGHGLEAEAADAIDVVDGEPHHVPQ